MPDLIDVPEWGDPAALLQLGNQGDEVLLREPSRVVVDAIAYGSGHFTAVVTCALLPGLEQSLERYPYWRDTDNCNSDFRPWLFPNPGTLP